MQLKLIVITFLLFPLTLASQPVIDVYFSSLAPESKGPSFSKVEEVHELLIPKSGTPSYFKIVKQYNSYGKIVSEKRYNKAGGIMGESQWEYNAKGELTKKVNRQFMNFKGWINEQILLTYNDTSGVLEEISLFFENQLKQRAQVIPDKDLKITEVLVFNEKNVLTGKERIVYLPQNNTIRVLSYKSNEQFIGATTYPLDPKLPEPPSAIKREFNSHGDIVLEALPNSIMEQGYFYEYTYDSYGNWTEKLTYQCRVTKNNKVRDKKLEYKITRKISY
ncbi:MAG: hypothetical protein WBJ36_01375 [Tenuifilum sp.]|uniref:hypothetical protein n=1 Tax=Tenuifilum sp. TaxID=2760880 RepID=UPI001B5D3AD1|nr:hypothetical protein [Bacteroidales bacterium]HOK60033.1 hypothetical protein [Tenuifilum sp.]MBP9028411.1 hypothetical protein [Bacteroidales bacterium]HOK84745.1 hypothetical protein [Tenuifilum sp.]HON69735.1 hypothetical protein [Tenuifilum sp.]